MPACYITLSENRSELTDKQMQYMRRIIAEGLNSNSRKLDETHIAIRTQWSQRKYMLGDIEIDIFSQLYLRRLFSRDKRANYISKKVSEYLNCCCATWINMEIVGFSRVATNGDVFYSDSDNLFVRFFQKVRGISTHKGSSEVKDKL